MATNNGAEAETNATAKRKARFLTAFAKHGTIYHAAKATPIDRSRVYRWIADDKAFAAAIESSKLDRIEMLEESFYERGLAGDNVAGIVWLKAHDPKRYIERVAVEVDVRRHAEEIAAREGLNADELIATAQEIAQGRGR